VCFACVLFLFTRDCSIGVLGIMVKCELWKDYWKPCIHKKKKIFSFVPGVITSENQSTVKWENFWLGLVMVHIVYIRKREWECAIVTSPLNACSKNEIIELSTQHRNRKQICFTLFEESTFSLNATFTRCRNIPCAFWFKWFECSSVAVGTRLPFSWGIF